MTAPRTKAPTPAAIAAIVPGFVVFLLDSESLSDDADSLGSVFDATNPVDPKVDVATEMDVIV